MAGSPAPQGRYGEVMTEGKRYWKVTKDGVAWDYSTHWVDCECWQAKIRAEEPESAVEIVETTAAEYARWQDWLYGG